jgi:HK97 family phage major capsid protein
MNKFVTVPASVLAALAMPRSGFVFGAEDPNIEASRARQQELIVQQQEIVNLADGEKRSLRAEEQTQLDTLAAEFDRLDAEINRRQRLIDQNTRLTAPQARQTDAEPVPGDDDTSPATVAPARLVNRSPLVAPRAAAPALSAARQIVPALTGNGGFRSFGDFAQAVVRGSVKGNQKIDARLQNAALSTYTQEGVGADGGFAIPPDFMSSIMEMVMAESSLISLCNPLSVSGNSITIPTDETTQWGTGGIKAYWEGEAQAITQSKLSLRQITVRLNKLAALVPVTEEMLEDSAGVDSYLRAKTPAALDWALSNALVHGTGAGQPLGFFNSAVLVTQLKESAQAADTIVAANALKMLARLPQSSRATAVWLIHPDAENQLPAMVIGTQPVYMPPGGMRQTPWGTLLGRPVIPHQVCNTLGDLGDLMLVDFGQYLAAVKTGGVRLNVSIHLWFDQDIQAFKFTMRVAGQPYLSAPITPRSGSTTMSPFVTLEARA